MIKITLFLLTLCGFFIEFISVQLGVEKDSVVNNTYALNKIEAAHIENLVYYLETGDNLDKINASVTKENTLIEVAIAPEIDLKNASYKIYNVLGKPVVFGRITNHSVIINISTLPKGFYILHIATNTHRLSKKILKK